MVLSPPPWIAAGVLALGLLACANRGMRAPSDGSSGSTGGIGGKVDGALDMAMDLGGGDRASGGAGGGGSSGCVVADGGADAGACNARFNFENCALYGATLNTSSQTGFKSFVNAPPPPTGACGEGALQVACDFTSDAAAAQGEVIISIGSQNLSGKTLTVRVMMNPATSNITGFFIIPVSPTGGYYPYQLVVKPVPNQWTTRSVTFGPVDAGFMMVDKLSIQVNSSDDYVGTLWVDEIDISTPPPDAGTGG
jgi:hypothetical protein